VFLIRNPMFQHYIKVALRGARKYLSVYLANIFGLAFGMACCTLCYLHIRYELSYDQSFRHKEKIFRLVNGNYNDADHWVKISAPLPALLKDRIPEIETYARFHNVTYGPQILVQIDESTAHTEKWFMMADPDFVKMFSLNVLYGSGEVLKNRHSVILTKSTALRLYGVENAIGKVITLKERGLQFTVGAIVEPLSSQTHLRFDYLISFENVDAVLGAKYSESWGASNFYGYLLLKGGVSPGVLESKIAAILPSTPAGEMVAEKPMSLQPLDDIHFRFNRGNLLPSYDIAYIYIFASLTLALLIVACINYVNLAITVAMKRVREVGVRKAIGASKLQIYFQSLFEAAFTTLAASAISLFFVSLLLPQWNELLQSSIVLDPVRTDFIMYNCAVVLTVTLISASYVSVFANRLEVVQIIKGLSAAETGTFSTQNILLALQFCLGIFLISASFIVSSQLKLVQTKNLGFDYHHVVNIPLVANRDIEKRATFKNELLNINGVSGAAASSYVPGQANWHQTIWWDGQVEDMSMDVLLVDAAFMKLMKIEPVDGQTLLLPSTVRDTVFLVNEAAYSYMGDAKSVSPFGMADRKDLAGVVRDFNYKSLHHEVTPLVIVVSDNLNHNQMSVKIAGNNLPNVLADIESSYRRVYGHLPFSFEFLDDKFGILYNNEQRLAKLIKLLTIVTMVMSLFGVYGLFSFTLESKMREIAIRKVLGVSFLNLMSLFSRRYLTIMLIASLAAIPPCVFLMERWLMKFKYHVQIDVWPFLLTTILTITLLLGMLFIRALRIQKINPAIVLKTE
jgi:putative ABC transport system permease protein